MLEYKQKRNNGRTPFAGVYKFVQCVCVCVWVNFCPSVQDISKSSSRIRMKFAEYVEFATISGKHIFRTISNISNINFIADH